MILSFLSNAPGASTLTICNDGVSTGYELLQGASFGGPVWEHQFSAPRGTQGARSSQGRLPNRQVQLPIRVAGSTKDDMAAKLRALSTVVDDLRRLGGICRLRSKSQTYPQNFEVLTASYTETEWTNRLEQRFMAVAGVTLICGPYVLGDPMDLFDDFSTDNVNGGLALYTADGGALTDLSVSSGRLNASANNATEKRFIYTGVGYTFSDHEATVQATPGSTITSFKAGVILNRIDASNYLEVYVDDNGANSRLRIDKVVATVRTNLATTNLGARVANGVRFWCRGRIEGNVIYAEHFVTTTVPFPATAPTTSTSFVMTSAETAVFGAGVQGKAGLVFTPQQAAAFLDDFEVLPFTYRAPGFAVLDCYGAIPGDAPALATARMATPPSGVSTAPEWALLAWAPRPSPENMIRNGDFEISAVTVAWKVSAVAGVTGAASSISQVSDGTLGAGAKYGENVGQVVTPATANTGASHAIYRRFRAGITYTATLWVRASSGTTNVRIRLGVSGDIASSTAVALSTTWTQHTATWTPTADVDRAYFAVEVTAATATTFQIDGAAVYQGTTAPSTGRQGEGAGGAPPFCVLQFDELTDATPGNQTLTVDATANGGFSMIDASVGAGGETYSNTFYVEPGLLRGDDYGQGEVSFEVYARIMLSAAFTGGATALLQAVSESGNSILYTDRGSSAYPLEIPSSGNDKWWVTRMGTLTLPRPPEFTGPAAQASRWILTVTVTVAAGTNLQDFRFDTLVLVPARSSWRMPTGKDAGTGYPAFLSDVTALYRTVYPDLTSTIHKPGTAGPAGGICGALQELPPGQVSVLSWASTSPPDRTDATSESEEEAFHSLHLGIVPRWHWFRDA